MATYPSEQDSAWLSEPATVLCGQFIRGESTKNPMSIRKLGSHNGAGEIIEWLPTTLCLHYTLSLNVYVIEIAPYLYLVIRDISDFRTT